MGLFGKKIEQLDKYRTEVLYEVTYTATYKDGSKEREKVQLYLGLNGTMFFNEICRNIKSKNENIAKVSIRNLRVMLIATKGNMIYDAL